MSRVIVCGLLAASLLAGCNRTPARPAAAETAPTGNPAPGKKADKGGRPPLKILPWLELSPGPGPLNAAADGLIVWQRVTGTVCISIEPGHESAIAHLQRRFPKVKIVPGLKTSPIFGNSGFDSVDDWRQVARRVDELARLTASKMIVFEHETAIRSYKQGKCRLDWDQLRQGLRQLPDEYLYLWYPSLSETGPQLDRLVRLCEVVDAECNVRFVDHAVLHAPKYVGGRGATRLHERLKELASAAPVPLIYCIDGEKYWPFQRIPEALRHVETDLAIIYPGAAKWEEAARALSAHAPLALPQSDRP